MPDIRQGTLVASTVTTVTFDADHRQMGVFNRARVDSADNDIWVTVNGDAPAIGADGSRVVPAGARRVVEVVGAGATVVKLVASGTPDFELEGS